MTGGQRAHLQTARHEQCIARCKGDVDVKRLQRTAVERNGWRKWHIDAQTKEGEAVTQMLCDVLYCIVAAYLRLVEVSEGWELAQSLERRQGEFAACINQKRVTVMFWQRYEQQRSNSAGGSTLQPSVSGDGVRCEQQGLR